MKPLKSFIVRRIKMKRLAFALILASLSGLLWSTLAQTSQAALTRQLSFGQLPFLTGLVRTAPIQTSATAATHHITLRNAQVSQEPPNRIVLNTRAGGDLPGALTLVIDRNSADNSITGGEWALVVSYIEDVPGGAHSNSSGHSDHAEEADGELLIQKGTLKGSITGGAVTLNADGMVTSVNSVQLNVESGTLTFNNVSGGTGMAHETNLQDFSTSSGTLSLKF
jgi:hypothetical protein